jgi:serine phosphatase RsbU (regulator of sigma subunit)
MTASFGFLHSLLASGTDPADAAIALNRFLHPRRPASRFVTLWIGVFDLQARTLTYVDCGHGWACLKHPDGTFEGLDQGGGLPCAIDDEWTYTSVTVPLRPGSRAVIVSDGYVEQFGLTVDAAGKPAREQFGMDGIKNALSTNRADDELKALLDAVVKYAGTPHLSDDATAIIIRWD